tara:strand:+ start:1002 stop:1436 length:435 start_codon:yes stop_codon:yes gene_type:complete
MFSIASEALDLNRLAEEFAHPAAGAFVTFEGRVRNHNEGEQVASLDYQAYEAFAVAEGSKIIEEAIEKFGLLECRCTHRVGHLDIGDLAVWVGVAAPHRADAFTGCCYVIDEVKKRVPIWKKEILETGSSHWVACYEEGAPSGK